MVMMKLLREMDCKKVVEDVNHPKANRSEYGFIIHKCCSFISNYQDYVVDFARRQANKRKRSIEELVFMDNPAIIINSPLQLFLTNFTSLKRLILIGGDLTCSSERFWASKSFT
jgi:hypothetical protein